MQTYLQELLALENENQQLKEQARAAAQRAGAILQTATEGRTDAEALEGQFIAALADAMKLSHQTGYNECMQAIAAMGASSPAPIQ